VTPSEYFKLKSNENGIPTIPNQEWKEFRSSYPKEEIKEALANYIIDNKIEFPFKKFSKEELSNLFQKFVKVIPELYYPSLIDEKFEFKYKYIDNPLGVIGKGHYFNPISNYYQQQNRYKCGSTFAKAPLQIWNDRELLKKMNWHFWRDGVMLHYDLDDQAFRAAFRLGTYVATQFKPIVAKLIYQKTNARNVLDMSCGWGDRLAGFYGTPNTKLYIGTDPNPDVYEVYKKQCVDFESFLGYSAVLTEHDEFFECIGSKHVIIYNKPFEDVDLSNFNNSIDVMFSSPPYFSTEKYGEGTGAEENQSWNRYSEFEKWKHDFLFKSLSKIKSTLKESGFLMVNIIDPVVGGKRLSLCDDMVDYVNNTLGIPYIGQILMEMSARPHTDLLKAISGEPIWCFSNENLKVNTIDNFFD
jgi:hypothetical protein